MELQFTNGLKILLFSEVSSPLGASGSVGHILNSLTIVKDAESLLTENADHSPMGWPVSVVNTGHEGRVLMNLGHSGGS